jgi:RNA polymerase sigma-70 factor, ECF subfamily
MSSSPIVASELVSACLESGSEAAWTSFVQRFQPLIAASILRVAGRYGQPRPALIDDLIQETYLRLCKNDYKTLRNFRAQHDEAIFGYIKVIAVSVALDHFRARATEKRNGEVEDDGTYVEASILPVSIEQSTLLRELEEYLEATETARDRNIFWLYYRQGYTAKDIASLPGIELTQKGVESCIYRLTQLLRSRVGNSSLWPRKGNPSKNTLGVEK